MYPTVNPEFTPQRRQLTIDDADVDLYLHAADTVDILHNNEFGEFSLSPKELALLKRNGFEYERDCAALRIDQAAIKLLGPTLSTKHKTRSLRVCQVPRCVLPFIEIDERDGCDTIQVKWQQVVEFFATKLINKHFASQDESTIYLNHLIKLCSNIPL